MNLTRVLRAKAAPVLEASMDRESRAPMVVVGSIVRVSVVTVILGESAVVTVSDAHTVRIDVLVTPVRDATELGRITGMGAMAAAVTGAIVARGKSLVAMVNVAGLGMTARVVMVSVAGPGMISRVATGIVAGKRVKTSTTMVIGAAVTPRAAGSASAKGNAAIVTSAISGVSSSVRGCQARTGLRQIAKNAFAKGANHSSRQTSLETSWLPNSAPPSRPLRRNRWSVCRATSSLARC
ncbi:hypothetical protein HMPREF3157_07090 [Dermabacter sp. HMSC06F07]|nr:hypothetical protein HMPREF3157_07090 [Dermabacter sp. HMSC06F07]